MDATSLKRPDFECIPRDLKAIPRWVGWRFNRKDDGSMGKVPQGATGNVDPHNPKNQMTFEDAEAFVRERLASGRWPLGGGIGFVFTDDDDIGGVDLDGCRDPETGKTAAWANRIIQLFDKAYVEYSPSGTGYHIITRGAPAKLAKTERAVPDEVLDGDFVPEGDGHAPCMEGYVTKRFFTVTGDHATGRMELLDRSAAWEQVAAYLRGDQPREERERVAHAAGQEFQPLDDEDLEDVRLALSVLSTDEVGRNTWVAFGMVLKEEFGEAGKPVWLEWMARSENDNAADSEKMWAGFKRPELMTVGSIFWHAQQKGWKRPRRKGGGGGGDSSGTVLAGILDGVELWHDPRKVAYATVSITKADGSSHHENMKVTGSEFSGWLTREFYLATGAPPKREKLREVVALAEARGIQEGAQHETWVRSSAVVDGKLYLDLGDEDWQAVEIDAKGWRVISDPPVRFRRSGGALALPVPVKGDTKAGIALLGDLIKTERPEHMMLLIGALVSYFRAGVSYVAINFDARPGSAKTSGLRVVDALVDPQVAATPGPPPNERELIISAQNQMLVRFDNVSRISEQMSDAYCRLLTGGGSSGRKLYFDEEGHVISVKRPMAVTLIRVTLRSDLAARSVVIPLARIGEAERLTEAEMNRRLAQARPIILGALLDGVGAALRREAEVEKQFRGKLPRMSDFAVWAEAAGEAFGWKPGEFIETYRADLRARQVEDAQDDQFCSAIFDWLCVSEDGVVEGQASDLREKLFHVAVFMRSAPSWFPNSPRSFAGALVRAEEQLEAIGVMHSERPHPHSTTRGRVHRLELNADGRAAREERRRVLLEMEGFG
jgi:hypothetical protein